LLEIIGFPVDSVRSKQRALKEIKVSAYILKSYGIIYEDKNKILYKKSSFDNKITFISSMK
jgi:hypothetical protein